MTDSAQELEQRLRNGDEKALAELFSIHRSRLRRTVTFRIDRRMHGRVDPDDVLQESYLAAAQRLKHFAAQPTLGAFLWLRLIVSQTLVDLHRRHLGAKMRDAGREFHIEAKRFMQSTSTSMAFQLVAQLSSPSRRALRVEVRETLESAIEEMDPIDREVLALRHFEELSNSEVAAVLEIQQKAASIRYVRAIKRLKDILVKIPGFLAEAQRL